MTLKETGITVLLAERRLNLVASFSGHGYIIAVGRPFAEGVAIALAKRPEIRQTFLGPQGQIKFQRGTHS